MLKFRTLFALCLGLLAILVTLAMLGALGSRPATAQGVRSTLTVCPAGQTGCDYHSIQEAVDAAEHDDLIKVSTGVYSGVEGRPVPVGYPSPPASGLVTQVVYISKTVTIRGGYTTTNSFADPPDPIVYPTVVDAQGAGRGFLIGGVITPTVENLRIIGGNVTGLGGMNHYNFTEVGGGIYIIGASPTISGNVVSNNIAGTAGSGGGIALLYSDATLDNNTVTTNTATNWYGGGLYLWASPVTLTGNRFSHNSSRWGGAIFFESSPATVVSNTFSHNSVTSAGGAWNVHESNATLIGNRVTGNTALYGGGMRLYMSSATLRDNNIYGNSSTSYGGGIHFWSSNATLINNIIANNQAGGTGTGVQVWASSPTLLHNTIARNVGSGSSDGSGIHIQDYQSVYSTVTLSNTILVSHSVGIHADSGNSAHLEGTLWGSGVWSNGSDWNGNGTIVTGTVNLWGEPAFSAPTAGDYHLTLESAAIDAGVNGAINEDLDGEPRPIGMGPEIGADEFPAGLWVTKQASPDPSLPGEPLTYTIEVANNGLVTLTATITDLLPAQVTPTGTLVWTPVPLRPGDGWTETVMVTTVEGYSGLLINVVRISTEEGVHATYTHTASVYTPPAADFSATPRSGVAPLTVLFDNGSAGDYTDSWWVFGDGMTSTLENPTHIYQNGAAYTVTLTVSGPAGSSTETKSGYIQVQYGLYLPLVLRN